MSKIIKKKTFDYREFNIREDEYRKMIGEFILDCNYLENQCSNIILNHFVDASNVEKSKEFVKSYFAKENSSFRGVVMLVLDILTNHHNDFRVENDNILCKDVFKKIVKLRNILAHSMYVEGVDIEYFTLSWISSSSELNEYKTDNSGYTLKIKRDDFKNYLKKLEEINHLLFNFRFELKK